MLAAITSPGTHLAIEHSVIVADGLDGLISRWSPQHRSASAYQTVTIRQSELGLRDGSASADGLELLDTRVGRAPGGLEAAVIEECIAAAERGGAPDLSALRAAVLAGT